MRFSRRTGRNDGPLIELQAPPIKAPVAVFRSANLAAANLTRCRAREISVGISTRGVVVALSEGEGRSDDGLVTALFGGRAGEGTS